jgi:hypothetical protein
MDALRKKTFMVILWSGSGCNLTSIEDLGCSEIEAFCATDLIAKLKKLLSRGCGGGFVLRRPEQQNT